MSRYTPDDEVEDPLSPPSLLATAVEMYAEDEEGMEEAFDLAYRRQRSQGVSPSETPNEQRRNDDVSSRSQIPDTPMHHSIQDGDNVHSPMPRRPFCSIQFLQDNSQMEAPYSTASGPPGHTNSDVVNATIVDSNQPDDNYARDLEELEQDEDRYDYIEDDRDENNYTGSVQPDTWAMYYFCGDCDAYRGNRTGGGRNGMQRHYRNKHPELQFDDTRLILSLNPTVRCGRMDRR